jgi:carbon starvation protein
MYHSYGRWLSKNIFKLDSTNKAPPVEINEASDFVLTNKGIVFGYHFTPIEGTVISWIQPQRSYGVVCLCYSG